MNKKRTFILVMIILGMCIFPLSLLALTSDKDIAVADGSGHYLSLVTATNDLGLYWKGTYTNDPGIRFNATSGKLEYRDQNESTWTTLDSLASGTGSGAPTTSKYIIQGVSDASLTSAQALGSLTSGILKNTTTTGVLSIASLGTDYYGPTGTDVAVADGGTGTSTGSITGTTALTFSAGGSNQNINLVPTGTGKVSVSTTLAILETGASPTKYTIFQGGDQTADVTYTLPTADGSTGQVLKTNGSGTLSWTATAPVDSKYITQTADSTLSGEQALSVLGNGLLKNTTGTGVLSIATAGIDYYNPGGTDVAVTDGGTGTSTGSITGTGTITFTAGGSNQNIILLPSGAGKVGIGTASPNDQLDVQGGSIRVSALAGAAGSVFVDNAGTLNLTSSDIRLKKDIIPITDRLNVLESLNKLRGVYYHWNTKMERVKNHGSQQEIGMIAQEVEKVLPEVVGTDNQGYKTLDYSKVTAYIIEVCKAQQAEIEELKKQVAELSKK